MHGIKFVGDDDMPAGHDFIFVHTDDSAMIFYRESALTPKVLEDSWAAYRATLGADETPPPERITADLPESRLRFVS